MTILDRILADKRCEVDARKQEVSLASLEKAAAAAPPVRSLRGALAAPCATFRVIAEVKKASPSKGVIREDFDAVTIARAYERGGARALSVLTDEKYFQGHLDFLRAIRAAVELPLLRKDFIIDSYQIWEARAAGADAILLIVGAFTDDHLLASLAALATDLGLDVLWEVHDAAELARLIPLAPAVVGINNRNLRTFEVSLETTQALLPQLPESAVSVSESGFFQRSELQRLKDWGVDGFLIGESLMRAPDPEVALRDLVA